MINWLQCSEKDLTTDLGILDLDRKSVVSPQFNVAKMSEMVPSF